MPPDRSFRRHFFAIATLHVVFVIGIYLFGSWQRKPVEQIVWLEGGSIGGGDPGTSEPAAVPEPPAPAEPEPVPVPVEARPEPLPPPPPDRPTPSELVTPKATPEPSTPKPTTPKPETPKPATPKPETPKPATPKPETPKPATPKPATLKATPKATPKPKPATPKATPGEEGEGTPKPKASPGEKPKGSPGTAKTNGAAAGNNPGTTGGNGPGAGNGKGPGKTGNGSGASEFGWYFAMLHDRFHARWDQPTSLVRSGPDFVTTLKLRIAKDGTILSHEIVRSSGDTQMDQSVMTAADRVHQIDPPPAGLTTGDVFEVNVAFKLDQGQ